MSPQIWGTSKDGRFEFVSLTSDKLEGALDVIRKSFFVDEKVCIGVELSRDPEAAAELEELCLRAARDGLSLIAVEKETQEVVGVAFNKLQVKTTGSGPRYFTQYAANCKRPSSKVLVEFMDNADVMVNLFDICKTDCLLEIMFLAVLREVSNQGIATRLVELTEELVNALLSGEDAKVSITNEQLDSQPVPTALSAIFTANTTQRVGEKLGFLKAAEIKYDELMFEGKSFASRIGPDTPTAIVEYKLL